MKGWMNGMYNVYGWMNGMYNVYGWIKSMFSTSCLYYLEQGKGWKDLILTLQGAKTSLGNKKQRGGGSIFNNPKITFKYSKKIKLYKASST